MRTPTPTWPPPTGRHEKLRGTTAGQGTAFRCVNHITRTHWTWVAYDRDTKVAFSACGGTWMLKGDKYEETNEFSTEDMKHARGKEFCKGMLKCDRYNR